MLFLSLLFLSPARGEEVKPVAVADCFKGATVEKWKGRRIALRYDLTKPGPLDDFIPVNPFLAPPRGGFTMTDGALLGRGVGALCHKGVFEADVDVKLTLSSPTPQDIGVLLLQPGVGAQFLQFALSDTVYSGHDKGEPPNAHMINVVGAEDSGEAGNVQFRYLARAWTPKLVAGAPIEIEVQKRGSRNRFAFAGSSLDGTDKYGKFPEVQPALFVLQSEMTVTALSISGKLAKTWLDKVGIAWDPNEADDEAVKEIEPPKGDQEPVEPPAVERPRPPRPPLPGAGATDAGQAITKFSDPSIGEKERRAAAATLTKENVKVAEFRLLINGLYSEDLLTRTLAIETLKRVTGKTLGYDPRASAQARKDAIRDWFRWFGQNRDRLK
ncbi:MAG: hypothetical protein MUE73_02200 [Planctomycetes bacterium]|nr:hypothetical protein [Planctomycetota bacterium]